MTTEWVQLGSCASWRGTFNMHVGKKRSGGAWWSIYDHGASGDTPRKRAEIASGPAESIDDAKAKAELMVSALERITTELKNVENLDGDVLVAFLMRLHAEVTKNNP